MTTAVVVSDDVGLIVLETGKLKASSAMTATCATVVAGHVVVASELTMESWHPVQGTRQSWRAPEKIGALCSLGEWCCAGGVSGALYLWEAWSGRLARRLDAHYKSLIAMSCTSTKLATGGDDALIRLWSVASLVDIEGRPSSATLDAHALPVTGLSFSDARLVSCSLDASVRIWENSDCIFSVACAEALCCVTFDAAESAVFAGGESGRVFSFDLDVAAKKHTPGSLSLRGLEDDRDWAEFPLCTEGHRSKVSSIVALEDRVVTASMDGTLRAWGRRATPISSATTPFDNKKRPCRALLLYEPSSTVFAPFFQRQPRDADDVLPASLLHHPPKRQRGQHEARPWSLAVPKLLAEVAALKEETSRWQKVCDSLWHYAVEHDLDITKS